MEKITAGYMKKLYKTEFGFLMKDHGFFLHPGVSFLRISNQMLHCITFGSSSYGPRTTTTVHVQFLFNPMDFFGIHVGGRIRNNHDEWFYFDTDENVADSIRRMKENIQKVALPFLDDSSSLEKIVSEPYQTKWREFWPDLDPINNLRALIYAYIGDEENFDIVYGKLEKDFGEDDRDWVIAENARLKLLKENFQNRSMIRNFFREWIEFTAKGLKLEKYVNVDEILPRV